MAPAPKPGDALPDAVLQALTEHGHTRTFPARAIVINEGDTTDALYIVLKGLLRVYSSSDEGREVVLAEYRPGEYFGELALDGGTRSASVRAIEASTCCLLSGSALKSVLAAHPDFALHLTHKLIRMVRQVTEQVKSLALQDVYGRLARLLSELAQPDGELRVVPLKLTQQDIADRIGASREMVNRVMKELFAGGYVSLRDGHYAIHRKLPPRW